MTRDIIIYFLKDESGIKEIKLDLRLDQPKEYCKSGGGAKLRFFFARKKSKFVIEACILTK